MTLPAMAIGIVLAAIGAVDIRPGDGGVVELIKLALVLTLVSDGLLVDRELLRHHLGPPVRALVIAMPLTLLLIGLFAKGLFGELRWQDAFLLAAVLTPTDPVVTSSVIGSRRVPSTIRHTLNLESGLNDGLALPFVLFFLVFAEPTGNAESAGLRLLGEAAVGAGIGVALGVTAGRLRLPLGGGIYAVAVGLAAYALADLTFGNGLIAAFVAGIALGTRKHRVAFTSFPHRISSLFQVVTFFVFGALIVATGYHGDVWRLAAFIPLVFLVSRPLPLMASLMRTGLPRRDRLFMSWFGPKGVASMLFALFVLQSAVPERGLIFDVAAFTVIASIAVHGLTDKVGVRWLGVRGA
jgi:NhaP-type Na+/H+ or K+/H+ antiporter